VKKVLIIIGVLIIVVGVFLLFTGDSNKNVKNYPSSGANIIAFGDSLVVGQGSTKGNDFVSVLSRQLNIPITNLGKRGDTTISALARLDDVLEKDPKIVLLLLGGNDYLLSVAKDDTFRNLGLIIKSIQDSGSIVIVLGVRGGLLKDNYKDDYKELSKQYRTAYVSNVLDDIIGNRDLMYDRIHPNDDGYKIMAGRIYPVIVNLVD